MWVDERAPPQGKSGSLVKGQGSEELPSQQQPWCWKAVGTAPDSQRSPAAAPAQRPRSSKPGKAHRAPHLRRLSEDTPSRASRPAVETKRREPETPAWDTRGGGASPGWSGSEALALFQAWGSSGRNWPVSQGALWPRPCHAACPVPLGPLPWLHGAAALPGAPISHLLFTSAATTGLGSSHVGQQRGSAALAMGAQKSQRTEDRTASAPRRTGRCAGTSEESSSATAQLQQHLPS